MSEIVLGKIGRGLAHTVPYDAVVEYIESPTGFSNNSQGAYINIGLKPKKSDSVELDVDIPYIEGIWQTAIGIYNPTFRVTSRNGSWFNEGFTRPSTPNGRNVWKGTYSFADTYSPQELTLNGQNENGSCLSRGRSIKYYGVKVTRAGVALRDLIPVRVGTVGYLYDRAHPFGGPLGNGLYPNAGDGAFVVGPDLMTSEEKMYKELFLQLMGERTKDLVVENDELTYLQGSAFANTCWLKTGIGTRYTLSVSFPNVTQIGCGSVGETFKYAELVSVDMPKLTNINGDSVFVRFAGTEISLPSLTNLSNHAFSYSNTLKILRLPNVTTKNSATNFFCYADKALEHVYMGKMTLAALGGAQYLKNQNCNSAAVFHLADGDYDYQGNPITA